MTPKAVPILGYFVDSSNSSQSFEKTPKVYTMLENPYSDLPHNQAFTFTWFKMFLKMLEYEVCISLNAL